MREFTQASFFKRARACIRGVSVEPELTEEVIARLQPLTEELIDQLNAGDDFERVADNIAMKARGTKGQVALYIHALIAASQDVEQ